MKLYDTYVVHLRTGRTIRGAVRRKRGPWVILAQATLLDGAAEPVALDGEVAIPRRNIDFAQRTERGVS